MLLEHLYPTAESPKAIPCDRMMLQAAGIDMHEASAVIVILGAVFNRGIMELKKPANGNGRGEASPHE